MTKNLSTLRTIVFLLACFPAISGCTVEEKFNSLSEIEKRQYTKKRVFKNDDLLIPPSYYERPQESETPESKSLQP